jgi:hypothetical protein
VEVLSTEDETRKLLKIREDLVSRIGRLQEEIEDLRRATAEIDGLIVRQGFRQPVPTQTSRVTESEDEASGVEEDIHSVKSKSGMTLGTLQINNEEIAFEPVSGLVFIKSIPPFQSFLVERVFDNMRSTDEERATQGEIQPEEVLSYSVEADQERIKRIVVRNYGGERRLREIQSSLRWTFDKMYDKLRQS